MPAPRRPKPIPPDPEGRNDERASWAQEAIASFMDACPTDLEDAVADLLCNLRHYCDRNNLSFMHEMDRARGMYRDETRAPEGPVTPVRPPLPETAFRTVGRPAPPTRRAEVRTDPEAPTPYTPPDNDVPF